MADTFLFTSESVSEGNISDRNLMFKGHPDKICDQISDAVVDACYAQDPSSHVACETATKTNMIMIFGEITTAAHINYEQVIRDVIKEIGYDDIAKGLDYRTCDIIVAIEQQSPEIAQAVHVNKTEEDIGAGDQGMMFGYATDEGQNCMPLTHYYSTHLCLKMAEVRKAGILKWIRPDAKAQVTIEYRKEYGAVRAARVHTIVISTQHDETVSLQQIQSDLKEYVIKPVIPAELLDDHTIYHLNPSGKFLIGGPYGDAGLTGRKIIVDTYGGWGAHGGGAFSGKDPSKVDRSGAYAARWIAKSLVVAGLCRRVLVQLSYAIGVPHPLSINVDTYGTGVKSDKELIDIINKNFDLRPGMIMRDLKLKRPIYYKTARYGHFGRSEPEFLWEVPKELVF